MAFGFTSEVHKSATVQHAKRLALYTRRAKAALDGGSCRTALGLILQAREQMGAVVSNRMAVRGKVEKMTKGKLSRIAYRRATAPLLDLERRFIGSCRFKGE